MDNVERRDKGLPYISDRQVMEEQAETRKKLYRFNNTEPWKFDELASQVREILGSAGKNVSILPPFYCDYGHHIQVGDNFFANYGCTILDVSPVKIGNNVMFAPRVSIYAAGHPLHPAARNTGYEYGAPVTIGDNVWLGGNVIVAPGVTIGENTVVGAGSVVTKDIPANVIAAGNPCRVIREITEEDRRYYFKDRPFDEESWEIVKEAP
ncbi:MAG TPA: sugar O-acetyltransferase [Candidatus Egerieimonas intestinavium]|uniref:Acetyltransferase n=1 Tax=Candidatus Egerieimonas intestinavium TaxID=2840777 RepID=A0A9D1EH33_9FIRM|nr:sugar O-acetyltransferase [Candidatus Egerieimonas intestinavium]